MNVKVREVKPVPAIVSVIAKNVRKILDEKNISGRKLAALSGQKIMRVNDLLNGRKTPGIDVVDAIADALGVGVDDLRRRPEKKSRKSA